MPASIPARECRSHGAQHLVCAHPLASFVWVATRSHDAGVDGHEHGLGERIDDGAYPFELTSEGMIDMNNKGHLPEDDRAHDEPRLVLGQRETASGLCPIAMLRRNHAS
jgi:hypothetical protein